MTIFETELWVCERLSAELACARAAGRYGGGSVSQIGRFPGARESLPVRVHIHL